MKPTKAERRAAKKEKAQKAIEAGEALKRMAEEEERHNKILNAAKEAGIKLKQINDGHIRVHFRGERGDQVSFEKAAPNYYQLLVEAGAVEEIYLAAVNRFYSLWEAHQRALGAWAGRGGAEAGDDPEDEAKDRQYLYTVFVKNVKPVYVLSMQILSECRDGQSDTEKLLNYLLPQTPAWVDTLKVAQGILENIEEIAAEERRKALALRNIF